LFINKTSPTFNETLAEFEKSSPKFRGKITFIYIDADLEINKELLDEFKVVAKDLPTYRLIPIGTASKSVPTPKEPAMKSDHFDKVIQEYLEIDGRPYYTSADLPQDWDKGPVKVLVAKNFHQVVNDKNKTVIVEFCKYLILFSLIIWLISFDVCVSFVSHLSFWSNNHLV
jgi:protein disulfide-isomerase A1